MVRASEKGNASGIKEALLYIPDNEAFMLIWSDLILSEKLDFNNLSQGCYVGVTDNFECSWSFINGKLENKPSDLNGLAGCFLFDSKKYFAGFPLEGSFARWLKETEIVLREMSMADSVEVSTIEAIRKVDSGVHRCRPYNHLNFLSDKVIKTGLTKEANLLIDREVQWYSEIAKYGFKETPKIYSANPLTMERIHGKNIFKADLDDKQKRETIEKLVDSLNCLHNSKEVETDYFDLFEEYYRKTIRRISSIRSAIPFTENEYIQINGRKCGNIFFNTDLFEQKVKEVLYDTRFGPIHGDCTLSNTIIDNSGYIYFIDARGYFGKHAINGDIYYDWAKLYYSINGRFDQFNIKKFNFQINDKEVLFEIQPNNWEHLTDYFLSKIEDCNLDKIKLIHAIIWLSLASHAWEDYDSLCVAFYNGIYLLDEWMYGINKKEEKKIVMSSLSKTWILDFDGALVEHNGYKKGEDKWLPGAKEKLLNIPEDDYVMIITSREKEAREKTEIFLKMHGIRYNAIFFQMPMGERILLNDCKPSGLKTAYAVECIRNKGLEDVSIIIDKEL